MTNLDYLLKAPAEEIKHTWESLGALTATNKTRIYNRNNIYLIDEPGAALHNAVFFCINTYVVHKNNNDFINWKKVSNLEGYASVYQNVVTPCFMFLSAPSEWAAVKDIPLPDDFIPYAPIEDLGTDINIETDELQIIMSEAGVPFLNLDFELEYTRTQFCNICIKPALQEYFKYYPIIKEQAMGNVGGNGSFKLLLPPYAYNAVAFFTLGVGAVGGTSALSPFAYAATEIMGGGVPAAGGGTFGRGVSYRKPVPGFTGNIGGQQTQAHLDQLAANQGYINKYRREKTHRIKENGKMYITGYSTIGGALVIKWLLWSPSWDMVEFEHLNEVRGLAKAHILRNLGMLRALVKSDIPGNIDYQMYITRADSLEEKILTRWSSSAENWMFTPTRGGL